MRKGMIAVMLGAMLCLGLTAVYGDIGIVTTVAESMDRDKDSADRDRSVDDSDDKSLFEDRLEDTEDVDSIGESDKVRREFEM